MEVLTLHTEQSRVEPNRTEPNRTEPDRARSLVDVCFYSPADCWLCCTTLLNLLFMKCLFVAMSLNDVDCEVLINVEHLRRAVWEQNYKLSKQRT
jgi:hypothetical protein